MRLLSHAALPSACRAPIRHSLVARQLRAASGLFRDDGHDAAAAVELLAPCCELLSVWRGETIIRQGEPADTLFVICAGRLAVHVQEGLAAKLPLPSSAPPRTPLLKRQLMALLARHRDPSTADAARLTASAHVLLALPAPETGPRGLLRLERKQEERRLDGRGERGPPALRQLITISKHLDDTAP